ncbi:alpha/beta-hydrolase family protein [Aureimonas altamirensis]|uniref:alpha/beta hydrolase n=1 Tax=Aureimonas altamirensis TaxID=370622 RepID=UPI002036D4EF|nr:alpha/beta-hydrolase family protein [Aureimonas altamirensis]MCM2504921.1 alpha/beta-hydrolase family protein [Aureimonas altamirensis]
MAVEGKLSGRRRWTLGLSMPGIVLGLLFFAASLTPSLLPRGPLVQGALSGASFAAGYAAGVFLRWLWAYMQLPQPQEKRARALRIAGGVLALPAVALTLWKAAEWQNSVRQVMGLEPVDTAHPVQVGLVALLVFLALLALARLFGVIMRLLRARLKRLLPPRVAQVLAIGLTVFAFWYVFNGVIFHQALRAADSSFRELDSHIDAESAPPEDPLRTGSAQSLVRWESLGARGRQYIASGPRAAEIGDFFGTPAQEPIRVYVGLNSRETAEERATLALQEMLRVGAFERSALVVIVPTGTGWIDPAGVDTLEYLHRGDIASVALQYSYLTSWLSLMVEPGYGAEAGRALFQKVYAHWTGLPPGERPRLYLYGLSLGAMNSELSTDLYEVVADPFDGALWSGPPFTSRTWRMATDERVPGTPEWLPRFRDGSIIRFTAQENNLDAASAPWGPIRIVYLQYASDPVTFFAPSSFYREPDWMKSPRGPDVSPALRWFPIVTGLQLAADMMLATTAPIGHGHLYAPEHYIDAWIEVTQPPPVDADTIARLKAFHAARFR